ncbi:MAG: Uma2 family endonuclease [Polyangiaceae bacterium]|nr:Uma2 family endonuclease [Polyangiaceae bacterium]
MASVALKLPDPERRPRRAYDPTFYPTEEKVGEDSLQRFILELLRPLIERWYAQLGKPTFVGADQFIYYERRHPMKVVAPDIYVLPGVPPGRRIKSWKTWKTGIVPSLAVEVVTSEDYEKDYREAPERYAELGVGELIIFDPDFERGEDRVRWQRYRKLKRGFAQVESTDADRIRSRVLGCFLRVVGEGEDARVRLGTGPAGDVLVPTEAEAERAAKEAALAAAEAERAAKEAALRRVAELTALLARQPGPKG